MTAEVPRRVDVAFPRDSATPLLDWPPIRAYRFSDAAYEQGIEMHEIDGVEIRAYSPAKTLADCFKFRNKLGPEIAGEALREGSDPVASGQRN